MKNIGTCMMVLVGLALGCGSSENLSAPDVPEQPEQPEPVINDVTGTYDGTISGSLSRADNADVFLFGICRIQINLNSQTGDSVTGTFTIFASGGLMEPCEQVSGRVTGDLCDPPLVLGCNETRTEVRLNMKVNGESVLGKLVSCSIIQDNDVAGSLSGFVRGGEMNLNAFYSATCPDGSGGTYSASGETYIETGRVT